MGADLGRHFWVAMGELLGVDSTVANEAHGPWSRRQTWGIVCPASWDCNGLPCSWGCSFIHSPAGAGTQSCFPASFLHWWDSPWAALSVLLPTLCPDRLPSPYLLLLPLSLAFCTQMTGSVTLLMRDDIVKLLESSLQEQIALSAHKFFILSAELWKSGLVVVVPFIKKKKNSREEPHSTLT